MPDLTKVKSKEQEDLETRARLFDKEFQELQLKYKMRLTAQILFPTGAEGSPAAVLTVPLILTPIMETPAKKEAEITDPTK